MLIAHELLFEELTKYLELHLIESKASWLRLHFTQIYEQSSQNNEFLELQNWCNNIIVKYPHKMFNSENFNSLQENALIALIRRDDLQMEEVKIWNYIIKWGVAQNSSLPSEPKDWSQENFQTLKTTLNNFLPLIRYFQMSKEDIINNVQPYYQILEETLWKDILKRLNTSSQTISSKILPPRIILTQNLPSRSTESFSTVINEEHAAEIASWIDKKVGAYSVRNNPYEFKLLVRGSRDGFTAKPFWNLCDKQTNVVVVMKVKGTNEILGGYNPVGWDKPGRNLYSLNYNSSKGCNDSFIFSLKNSTIQNSILSRVTDLGKDVSIYCNLRFGPSFTSGLFMKEPFNLLNHCYCWYNSSEAKYERIRNKTLYVLCPNNFSYRSNFTVDEYEVFQIYNKNT
ncbi:hypothetical protein C2G38_945987 [Gigaspora rosea]|uniref:TLDc domain-containing protein n=1 Tax=Gigaspora rosea TaxID=44941 RepID=A0A397VUV1_9GLOM|nr:hypothetical protein C2G38_945987 [Gigaspora rosea]